MTLQIIIKPLKYLKLLLLRRTYSNPKILPSLTQKPNINQHKKTDKPKEEAKLEENSTGKSSGAGMEESIKVRKVENLSSLTPRVKATKSKDYTEKRYEANFKPLLDSLTELKETLNNLKTRLRKTTE